MTARSTRPATVFFDGGCRLCAREIAHYQRRHMAPGVIEWVDITRDTTRLEAEQLSQAAATRRLHVRVGAVWLIGVPGFIAIWQRIPVYRPLAWCVRALHLQRPLQWLYVRWADRRYVSRCGGPDSRCAVEVAATRNYPDGR